jgi:CRISPR/Cas system-associated exonuclease Cas4 (RecB family)
MMTAEQILKVLCKRKERGEREIYVTDVTKCLKKAYYSILRPKEIAPQAISGRLLHEAFARNLQQSLPLFFEVGFAFGLENGWVLRGRCDAIAGDAVYEFKFTRSIGKAKENAGYYLQLQLYCYAFRAKKGYLVLIDRETFDMEFVEIQPDIYVAEKLIEDAKYLCECLEKREIPKKLSPRFDGECEFCDYVELCSGGGEHVS